MIVCHKLRKKPWIVKYREPWTGKQRQKAFLTEQEAKSFDEAQSVVFEKEKAIIRAVKQRRKKNTPSSATVEEILLKYLDTLGNPVTRATSSSHLQPIITIYGKRKAHCLTIEDVNAFLQIQQQRGVGKGTATRRVKICLTAFNWAVRWGMLASNPLTGLKLPVVATHIPAPPTPRELQLAYDKAAPHVQRVIVLGMSTGARIGPSELFRLRWSDVDLENAVLRMPNADKGSKLEAREVPIREDIVELLKQWERDDTAIGCPWVIHHKGKQVQCINRAWQAALRRAGIERRIRPYDLRHAFASRALEYGADLKCVAEIMGHADEKMLLRVYQHTNKAGRKRAIHAAPSIEFGK